MVHRTDAQGTGCDQVDYDGGDTSIWPHEGTELDTAFVKDGILLDPACATSPEFKCVLLFSYHVVADGKALQGCGCRNDHRIPSSLKRWLPKVSRYQSEGLRDKVQVRQLPFDVFLLDVPPPGAR